MKDTRSILLLEFIVDRMVLNELEFALLSVKAMVQMD